MILQSLVSYYEALAEKGEIARPGWALVKVSWALEIDENGLLLGVLPLKVPNDNNKKMIPRLMLLPAPAKRSVDINANFLCDNATYILGIDGKGNPERTKKCFNASKELHQTLLGSCNEPIAKAIYAFFENWHPESAKDNPLLAICIDDLYEGANLVFMFAGEFAHENSELSKIWQNHYDGGEDGCIMRCLITGEQVVPATTHPAIKGVRDCQSSGAALVSFNAPAYCSFNKEQNINAPVGKYAAFAYTTALNHLLSNKRHIKQIGDTTVVYWAEDADIQSQDLFSAILDGGDETVTDKDLDDIMKAISRGEAANWDGVPLEPDNRFYVLGLAPNAARISVRFFLQDSFGNMVRHLKNHYDRLEIISDNRSKWKNIPLWALLRETVNPNSSDKTPSPQMSGDVLRAILTGGRYPATLYNQTMLRIKVTQDNEESHVYKITRGRAAIIKAFLLRNLEDNQMKEVLTMALNEQCNYTPYVLGRLFSVLESTQQAANPDINATIKDRFFNSACATPAAVFPIIMKLSNSHLKKLEGGLHVYWSKQIGELAAKLEGFPQNLSLNEQGAFILGYYHQTQKRYEKKEDK